MYGKAGYKRMVRWLGTGTGAGCDCWVRGAGCGYECVDVRGQWIGVDSDCDGNLRS